MAIFKEYSHCDGALILTKNAINRIKEDQYVDLGPAPLSNNTFLVSLTVGYYQPDGANIVPDTTNRTLGMVHGHRSYGSDNASSGFFLVNAAIAGYTATGRGLVTFELMSRGPMIGAEGRLVYFTYNGVRYLGLQYATGGHIAYDGGVRFTGITYRDGQMHVLDSSEVGNVEAFTDTESKDVRIHKVGLTLDGGMSSTSDIRLKENLKPIRVDYEKLFEVFGYTFLKNYQNERDTGLVAQEVEHLLPEAVRENSEGHKSVAYGEFFSYLIETIKGLRTEVEELKELKRQRDEK